MKYESPTPYGSSHIGKVKVWDFNENVANGRGRVEREMIRHGFLQSVHQYTTENYTTIDHVYVRKEFCISCRSVPTYFSDHSAIILSRNKESWSTNGNITSYQKEVLR